MDYPTYKSFIHPDVLAAFGAEHETSLRTFYDTGTRDYSTFANSFVGTGVPIRFDSDVYILKRAFVEMYGWILQNKAFLKNLNLSGIGIAKSEIYDHFFKLRNEEMAEIDDMRQEAMNELARKQTFDANGKSGTGFVRYTAPRRTFFRGYH